MIIFVGLIYNIFYCIFEGYVSDGSVYLFGLWSCFFIVILFDLELWIETDQVINQTSLIQNTSSSTLNLSHNSAILSWFNSYLSFSFYIFDWSAGTMHYYYYYLVSFYQNDCHVYFIFFIFISIDFCSLFIRNPMPSMLEMCGLLSWNLIANLIELRLKRVKRKASQSLFSFIYILLLLGNFW